MNIGSKVKINVFDDGNQIYEKYENIWIVFETFAGGGKLRLFNLKEKDVKLYSISTWKVTLYKIE
tara:strand:+ start:1114 stop:1308 length:195 start_codon:yes stop_codon:yes gene_type:complete